MLTDTQHKFLRAMNDMLVEQGEHMPRPIAVKLDDIPREGHLVVTSADDTTNRALYAGVEPGIEAGGMWREVSLCFKIYPEEPIDSTAEDVIESTEISRRSERTAVEPSRQLPVGSRTDDSEPQSDADTSLSHPNIYIDEEWE